MGNNNNSKKGKLVKGIGENLKNWGNNGENIRRNFRGKTVKLWKSFLGKMRIFFKGLYFSNSVLLATFLQGFGIFYLFILKIDFKIYFILKYILTLFIMEIKLENI